MGARKAVKAFLDEHFHARSDEVFGKELGCGMLVELAFKKIAQIQDGIAACAIKYRLSWLTIVEYCHDFTLLNAFAQNTRGVFFSKRGRIMRFYVAVTDSDWFRYLRSLQPAPEDINFWQPSGKKPANLAKGEPFLFKLHAPFNKIAGLGFFSAFATFPLGLVWEAFGERNGCETLQALSRKIAHYQGIHGAYDPRHLVVGCNILTDPVFFNESEMIEAPLDWSSNIMVGKYYDTRDTVGSRLWEQVIERLQARRFLEREPVGEIGTASVVALEPQWREVIAKVRVGQGAFRIMVTEAYRRACAVTADHTLPVLEAAHIKPFSEQGPHLVSNGLLLRADLHKLFDEGYMTVTPDYHIEISRALKEEFNNGRIYYDFHGKPLANLPENPADRPSRDFLRWHNEVAFKAG